MTQIAKSFDLPAEIVILSRGYWSSVLRRLLKDKVSVACMLFLPSSYWRQFLRHC